MYHSISDDMAKGVHPYYETSTSPSVFARHMKYIHENGYQVINIDEAIKVLNDGMNATEKRIVITFDDGFRDFHTHAFPVLKEYNFSATVFLPTAFINNAQSRFKGKECLSWNEVRELRREGVCFGSHTVNHLKLINLNNDEIEFELKASKEQIENEIGETITSFSYPFAFPEHHYGFKRALKEILKKNGYENGVSTVIGTALAPDDERFFIKRIPVNSFDDRRFFKAKLEDGYEWLHSFQYLYKQIKRLRRSKYRRKGAEQQ